jgi:hypothetical protein
MIRPWIGVDLDGTLAHYSGWVGPEHIGDPVPAMAKRVNSWLADDQLVKIFTARVWSDGTPQRTEEAQRARDAIQAWCLKHFGVELEVTCVKDFGMVELWDDRAVGVRFNEGEPK